MLSAAPVRWLVAIDCTAELAGTTRRKDKKKKTQDVRPSHHPSAWHGMAGEASQEGSSGGEAGRPGGREREGQRESDTDGTATTTATARAAAQAY